MPRDHTFDHCHTCIRSKLSTTPVRHALPLYVSSPYCRQSVVITRIIQTYLWSEGTRCFWWLFVISLNLHRHSAGLDEQSRLWMKQTALPLTRQLFRKERKKFSARQDLVITHVNSSKPTTTTLHYEDGLRWRRRLAAGNFSWKDRCWYSFAAEI